MKHLRHPGPVLALLAGVLAGAAHATEWPVSAPPAVSDAPRAAATTAVEVLGAAIVERPAAPESLRARPATGRAWRRFALSPHREDRCEYFLAFEISGGRAALETRDELDPYFLSHAFVLMRNLDPNWAVGGGLQFHWATGNFKAAPEVRVRRWFGKEQSVEAAFGWVIGSETTAFGGDFLQQAGPIASLRYSPRPWVFAQAGAARYRELPRAEIWPPLDPSSARESTRAFAGIGFAGPGALAALGCEAVAFVVLLALFSGMS